MYEDMATDDAKKPDTGGDAQSQGPQQIPEPAPPRKITGIKEPSGLQAIPEPAPPKLIIERVDPTRPPKK